MYFVKCVTPGSVGAQEFRYAEVAEAQLQACSLIAGGAIDVSIEDGRGNRIEGLDLKACCDGQRSLTSDLRAV